MIVSELAATDFSERLQGRGLGLRAGPLSVRIRSDVRQVADGIQLLYADFPVVDEQEFCDYLVRLEHVSGFRRWVRPQVQFLYDHRPIFEPLPQAHALPLLEWALNWCISQHTHQFLVVHAAVVERSGSAVILPAPPGSGKSTLCAALTSRGWRLLSDELALISLTDGRLHALARPISLKNRSIEIISAFEPSSVFSAPSLATAKGTVALLKSAVDHVHRADEVAVARWIVFPQYVAEAPPTLAYRPKPETMVELGRQAFNYGHVAREAFQCLADIIRQCETFSFSYSKLDDAVEVFDRLANA